MQMNLIVKSSAIALGLLIGLGSPVSLVLSAEAKTQTPSSGGSSTVKEIDQVINSDAQTYSELVQQSEILATQLIGRELQNAAMEMVLVRISGDRFGNVAPILLARVSRKDWQAKPNIRDWSRYAGQYSQQLLGYLNPPPQAPTMEASSSMPFVPENSPSAPGSPAASSSSGSQRRAATSNRVNPLLSGAVPEDSDLGYR